MKLRKPSTQFLAIAIFALCSLCQNATAATYCDQESQELFARASKADAENQLEAARLLYRQAADACDNPDYWQAVGDIWSIDFLSDSAAAVNEEGTPAMEAYGKAFTSARRDRNEVAGALAARSMVELGLLAGDPIKANEWLLVAQQLEPSHSDNAVLQQEVDFARQELSSNEIETGLSQTRGLGRVNSLLAGGAAASAYWDPAPVEQAQSPTVNNLATSPLETGLDEGGGTDTAATTISIPINFESNSTAVTPDTSENLENLARVLAAGPTSTQIELIGHADVRGDESYNLRLSQNRADYVRKLIIQLQPSLAGRIASTGKGESEPVDRSSTERAHKNNRRLVITVSG